MHKHRLVRPRSLPVLMLILSLLSVSAVAETRNGIHVAGRGTLEVEPDMGYVQLRVRREGTSAGRLKEETDSVVAALLELADGLSIARQDVTATALSISPRYQRRNNESVVEGLIASRTVSITLRKLDQYGELMSQALAAGVNNVDPINLDSSRREALENEALEIAMRDATAEAQRVADGFSVAVGPIINVQVGIHNARPQMASPARAMAAESVDFSPGLIHIERTLSATFAILSN